MGMSKSQVGRLFMQIGLILSAASIGLGVLIGSGLSLYLEFYPLKVLPDIYIDSEIPAHLEVSLVITIFIVGMTLSFLGMRYGTRSVTKWSPTDCLRN
jgi:ABC-type lipoprotein release transport system permease subunit